jgi:hypothetical protein
VRHRKPESSRVEAARNASTAPRLLWAALAFCAASSLSVATAGALSVLSESDANFISGGVDRAERAQMIADAPAFDLFVTFAQGADGSYLNGVDLRVEGPSDGPTLEIENSGPLLLGELPPGDYTLFAELPGWQRVRREVRVDGRVVQTVRITMEPETR